MRRLLLWQRKLPPSRKKDAELAQAVEEAKGESLRAKGIEHILLLLMELRFPSVAKSFAQQDLAQQEMWTSVQKVDTLPRPNTKKKGRN